MADVTIDMDDLALEDAADRLDESTDELEPGETLTVDLRNLDARAAFAFFEGALDAGYRVSLTELAAQPTGNQTILQMIQDDEIVHIDELTVELEG
jgi:hypothetical protein